MLDKFDLRGVYFLPGKNLLVSHGSDDNLKIWRLSDGKLLHTVVLDEYENPNGVAISPDGKTLAFVTYGRVYWLNTQDFSIRQSDAKADEDGMQQYDYRCCAFSKDGSTLYVGGGNFGEVALWRAPLHGARLERIGKMALAPQALDAAGAEPAKGAKSIHLTADGKGIVVAAGSKEAYLFTLADRKGRRLTGVEGSCLTVLPKGQVVASVFSGGKSTVRTYSPAYQVLAALTAPFQVVHIESFPRANKCLLVGADQYAILNADAKKIEGPFRLPTTGVRRMAVDEQEANIAYGSVSNERATLAVRHLKNQQDILVLGMSLFQAGKAFANGDASGYLVGKSASGHLKALRIQNGGWQVKTLPFSENLKFAALSKRGQSVFMPFGGAIQSFDAAAPAVTYAKVSDVVAENGLVVSEQGNRAAALTNNGAVVFDLDRRVQIAHLLHKPESREVNQIYSAAFSPDGRYLVACYGAYNTVMGVKCWDAANGAVLWHLEGSEFDNFKYSADGKEIFCIENGRTQRAVRWLDAATGKTLRSVPIDMPQTKGLKISIAPDNSTFLDLSRLTLYETKTGKKLPPYQPNGVPYGAALMANGYYAIVAFTSSANEDNLMSKMVLYDFARARELATLYLFDDSDDWALITPQGHYDATPGAMQKMYYQQGLTLIGLDALADRFYYPRLLEKLLNDYRPPSDDDIKRLKKPPVVKLGIPVEQRNLVVEDEKTNIPQYVVRTERIKISVEATAPDDVIRDIRLYQNGKLVQSNTRNLVVEDEGGAPTQTAVFEIALAPGDNRLRAIAVNSQRLESAPDEIGVQYAPAAEEAQKTPSALQLHVVVVGINQYKNPKYNLNYATADAAAFTQALQEGASGLFANLHVHRVSDGQATRDGIVAALEQVKKQARPQDVFLFYYAGHGVLDDKNRYYLVPHDVTQLYGNWEALAQQGLSAAQLQQYAREIPAQKQVYLLDACQSAGALQQQGAAARGAAEERAIAQLARATGTHWITASGSEQFASEFAQLGHGVFTYALLEALKGKADNGDKRITVKEIDAYLQAVVPELTARYKGTPQYPASYGFGNDFPVGVVQ
ncbi:MAG: caspase family protein [Saprospiraceae bacterium]|nr:caspase family protein [Saprospiraceae bacterium]